MIGTDNAVRPNPADDPEQGMPQTMGVGPLLFGLSLAAVLLPSAMLIPQDVALPTVRPDPHAIICPAELAAILDRTIAEVGRVQIALGEVDQRLHRLNVALDVFQVTDGSGILISIGVVTPCQTASGVDGATILDLWTLACEAFGQADVTAQRPIFIGSDAILVVHGGITAQMAWLAGDRLVTASVTSLDRAETWAVKAVCAIAMSLDRQLRRAAA